MHAIAGAYRRVLSNGLVIASARPEHAAQLESLQRVVFGQPDAVHLVAQAIKRSRAGLGQPDRPAG